MFIFSEVFIVHSPKFHKGDASQGCIVLNIWKNECIKRCFFINPQLSSKYWPSILKGLPLLSWIPKSSIHLIYTLLWSPVKYKNIFPCFPAGLLERVFHQNLSVSALWRKGQGLITFFGNCSNCHTSMLQSWESTAEWKEIWFDK